MTEHSCEAIASDSKVCTKCRELKSTTGFAPDHRRPSRLQAWCKACYAQYRKDRLERMSPEERTALRDIQLKSVYGITSDERKRLLDGQGGKCAICAVPVAFNGSNLSANIDHSHDTRRVRGILCSGCNTGLGMFHDNAETLMAAARYLRAQ